MDRRNAKVIVNFENLTLFFGLIFMGYVLFLLLKYVLYDTGSFWINIMLSVSIVCTRYYLSKNQKSLRTHEKACLVLFVMYDRNLLDFFNIFLLVGVGCIRESLRELLQEDPPVIKEFVTLGCGLIFLLMNWFAVGRILIIYNFAVLGTFALLPLLVMLKCGFGHFRSDKYANEWDDVN